jgi:5-methyltetrahydrofolate--homocysteine methyltransferase
LKSFLEEIRSRILIYDGSKGYMIQKLGLKGGECGEEWNISKPEVVKQIYQAYKEAGADVIQTNTFTGSRVHLEKHSLGDKVYEINYQGARLAREVMGADGYVAASIGPSGILFEPSGEMTFERAYEIYMEQVTALAEGGVDILNFETFTDMVEMRAALLAAKENTKLPVICSLAYESNGRTLMGTDPQTAAAVLLSLGADMVGTNCSFGAEHMLGIVRELGEAGGSYLSVKPNAGIPEMVDGKVIYRDTPDMFADFAGKFAGYGARLIGGCCGTTPEHVTALRERLSGMETVEIKERDRDIIASVSKRLKIGPGREVNLGKLEAVSMGDVMDAALDLSSEGYDAVYINVDSMGSGDNLLMEAVNTVQGYVREPLILETSNPQALVKALRIYRGIAGVVSNPQDDTARKHIGDAVEKYGGILIERNLIGL